MATKKRLALRLEFADVQALEVGVLALADEIRRKRKAEDSRFREAGRKGAREIKRKLEPRDRFLFAVFSELQKRGMRARAWPSAARVKLDAEIRRQRAAVNEWYTAERQAVMSRKTSEEARIEALRDLDAKKQRRLEEVFEPLKYQGLKDKANAYLLS